MTNDPLLPLDVDSTVPASQLDAGTLLVWLDALVRAYGSDLPIWVETETGFTVQPLVDVQCIRNGPGRHALMLRTAIQL